MTVTTRRPLAGSATVQTTSAEQTRAFAAALAGVAQAGDRIALLGPLGAGKTQFAKGFATGLGVSDVVNSPSFTLMAEYAGRLPLFHQDLYRLNGPEDVLGGGLVDQRQEDGVTLIEWGERLSTRIDPRRLSIHFAIGEADIRTITVDADQPAYGRYIKVAGSWSAS